MITFVQVMLLLGSLLGGTYAFELFEKNATAGAIACVIFALIGLAGVVALELIVKR